MQRLRASGTSIVSSISAARLKRKAVNSWTAVQDTFYSTKDVFERHKVVFTVGTSVASVATAWIGYTLRHYHDIRVDRRLESIEEAMRTRRQLEHSELTKAVNVGKISVPACFATAGTCLIIGSVSACLFPFMMVLSSFLCGLFYGFFYLQTENPYKTRSKKFTRQTC